MNKFILNDEAPGLESVSSVFLMNVSTSRILSITSSAIHDRNLLFDTTQPVVELKNYDSFSGAWNLDITFHMISYNPMTANKGTATTSRSIWSRWLSNQEHAVRTSD
ncbi:hypothetical protein RF11_02113 [Thelohanellus kitauei]|uniref:Uncharacterized protein n=1 Tax=Thelohanellus kitauei TaxID=669202 RepID=A0A0C2J586_THEKT|nr:hypothetical protein RF11_02113 [Thelohanellus kitauei]